MKPLLSLLWIGLSLLVFNCEPEADLYRHFIVREGEHYSSPRVVETLKSEKLSFEAIFRPSCQYLFEESGYQDSKNKLLGFADCNSLHHENSARFGWQWLHDQLEIYAYCYVNGERVEKFVGVAAIGEVNHFEIQVLQNEYVFTFNNEPPVAIARGSVCNTGVYYMLWPYFGGTLAAPHDVHLSLKINY
jgi:hypothetical protein